MREPLDDGDVLADKAIAQEQEGKKLLQRLEDGTPGDPDYQEALTEFVKAGREHIAYEQEVVWPAFEAAISREDLVKMGERLEAAKKIAPTRPHPDTPPNPGVLKTMGMVTATRRSRSRRCYRQISGQSARPPNPLRSKTE